MASILDRIMRAGEGKILRDLSKVVEKVNAFESSISALTDDQLRAKTEEFKKRLTQGETLDDLLPRPSRPSARDNPPPAPAGRGWPCYPALPVRATICAGKYRPDRTSGSD